jgi:hypothetical protein
MNTLKFGSAVLVAVVLAGCASAPLGPRVAVMPAPGKPFDLFAAEERMCRQYADQSVGAGQDDPAARRAFESGLIGTTIGALAGAAVGGRDGAAVGAAAGLVTGAAVGHGEAGYVSRDMQRRYDIAYQQCMYAKGNQIPGAYYRQSDPPPARVANYPPPPPQSLPPPPPPPR